MRLLSHFPSIHNPYPTLLLASQRQLMESRIFYSPPTITITTNTHYIPKMAIRTVIDHMPHLPIPSPPPTPMHHIKAAPLQAFDVLNVSHLTRV